MFFQSFRWAMMGLLAAGAMVLGHGGWTMPALAQDRAAGSSEVTVDLDVLDSVNGHAAPPRHHIVLHPPGERHVAVADSATTPAKRAAAHDKKSTHTHHAARTKEKHARKHVAAHGKATDADRKREQARIKREEAERIREAKAEIEQAAREAAPRPANADKIPLPGPGPATPPAPTAAIAPAPNAKAAETAPPPAAPPAKSGQVATMTPPAPAMHAAPATRAKPAALEQSGGPPHVDFVSGTADLTPEARAELDAVAKTLAADVDERVQLVAYATGANDEANQARRLSLSRALNVRAYLIDHGVRNTRMDVRALGNRPDGDKPADRVEILFLAK